MHILNYTLEGDPLLRSYLSINTVRLTVQFFFIEKYMCIAYPDASSKKTKLKCSPGLKCFKFKRSILGYRWIDVNAISYHSPCKSVATQQEDAEIASSA